MTFRVIMTGRNDWWGKDGEEILMNDGKTLEGIKAGWIYPDSIKYVGQTKITSQFDTKFAKYRNLKEIYQSLERQNNSLEDFKRKIDRMIKINNKYLQKLESDPQCMIPKK